MTSVAPKLAGTSRPPGSSDAATSKLLGRLIRTYVRLHIRRIGIAAACMAVVAASTAANAWLMEPVLDEVFLERNERMLIIVPLIILLIALVKGLATYFQAFLMATVGQRIIASVQLDLFAHLMNADLAFFHRTTTGKLIANFLNDANLLNEAVSKALTGMAKDSVTVIFLIGLMFYQDWRLAAVTCAVLPIAIVPMRNLGKRMRKASTETQQKTGRFGSLLAEAFQGARHIKAYGMELRETSRAEMAINARLKSIFKVVKTRAMATPIVETLGALSVAAVIYYGGSRVLDGATTPGTFFSFIAALIMAYQPIRSLANLNTSLQEGLSAAQRIFAMIDVKPEILERKHALPFSVSGGEIEFDNVCFSYENGKTAIHGLNLKVPAGHSVALVGASGAGKSTLINLIPRFFDVGEGSIRIDGTDVRAMTITSLRNSLALVSQESTLFNDTVSINIGFGRVNASEEEIRAAARDAAAHEFIMELPQGYDTVVGEGGVKLSGGQRQRIVIARAMLKDAPILLLDEATSALDSQAERKVQVSLRSLMKGRTTLVVAHRLSTIADADEIHVIDEGTIIESGDHVALLSKRGAYARLYAAQTSDPTLIEGSTETEI